MMRRILTIWGKEMLDALRDRRTLVVMVLAPAVMMPAFVLLPQFLIGGQIREGREGSMVVGVHGAAHGPELVAFLRGMGAEVNDIAGDPEATVRDDRSKVAVVIPPDFAALLQAEQPAQVRIVLDDSNTQASVAGGRLRELLEAFGRQVASERLARRGLDAAIMTPVVVERRSVASEAQLGGMLLSMVVPMFLVLFAFLGGMYTAIDVTAGEKERGTLEPLLTAPVSRSELVLGKLLAVFVTSFGAVLLSLVSMYATFQLAPADLFGQPMSFALPMDRVLLLVAVALPLTLLLNGVEMIVCLFARSFKEAQNYITPLQLILMVPALVVGLVPAMRTPAWSYALPAVGQITLFRDILGGAPDLNHLALGLVSSSAYAVLAIVAAVRLFQRETVLFRT